MRVRQALRRLVVALALVGSLVPGSGLAGSAAHVAAQRPSPAIAGIYMNYDSISGEPTTDGFKDWLEILF